MDKFLFFQLTGRAGFCHYKFYLDFLHCLLFRFFDKESRLEDINLKLSINRNSRLTIDSLPSLFINLSTTTSLLNDMYFSSLLGMHLIFSPWEPRNFFTNIYHLLREFKLIIYLFYSLFKTIYKYPSHIVVFAICSLRYGILLVQTIIEAFYVITKRARRMFLVCIRIRHTRVWLANVYRFDK